MVGFFVLAICFFAKHIQNPVMSMEKPKQFIVSLYWHRQSQLGNLWQNLDSWTKGYLGENPKDAADLNEYPLFSKYNSGFTYATPAPKKILQHQL
jgi:hypothetical protein